MSIVAITRPGAGQHYMVSAKAGVRIAMGFPADQATLERVGNDLVFNFEDNSSARISGFYEEYTRDSAPDFEVNGTLISGTEFFNTFGPDIAPAAGPTTIERGSHYNEHGTAELTGGIDHLDGLDHSIQGTNFVAATALAEGMFAAESKTGIEETGIIPSSTDPVPPPPLPVMPHHARLVLSHANAEDEISFYAMNASGTMVTDPDNIQVSFADIDQTWFENLTIDPITGKISFNLTNDGVNALKSGEAFFTNLEVTVDGQSHAIELFGKENDSYRKNSSSSYHSEDYDSATREQDANIEGKLTSEWFVSSNKEVKSAEIHLGGERVNHVVIDSTLEEFQTYDRNASTGLHRSTITSSADQLNVSIGINDIAGTTITGIDAGHNVNSENETKILSNGGDLNLSLDLESKSSITGIVSHGGKGSPNNTTIDSGGGNLTVDINNTARSAHGIQSVDGHTMLHSAGGDLQLAIKNTTVAQTGDQWSSTGLYAGARGFTDISSAGGSLKVGIDVTGGASLVGTGANLGISAYGMKTLGEDALNEINSGDGQLTVSIKVAAGHAANACAMFAAGGTNRIVTTGSEDASVTLTAYGNDGSGTAMRTGKSELVNTQTGERTVTWGTNEIMTGSGNDHIEINGAVTAEKSGSYSNIINAGGGNNTIILNGSVQNGSLKIITGDGYDTLVLKADNFDQLKAFYGSWLNGLQSKNMIKDMSIDRIDIQYTGAEAETSDIIAWVKGYFGTEVDIAVNGDIAAASTVAATFGLLVPEDLDDHEHSDQVPPDQQDGGSQDPAFVTFSVALHNGPDIPDLHDVLAELPPLSEYMGDESLFGGSWENFQSVAVNSGWAQGNAHPVGEYGGSAMADFLTDTCDELEGFFHGVPEALPNVEESVDTELVADLTNREMLGEIAAGIRQHAGADTPLTKSQDGLEAVGVAPVVADNFIQEAKEAATLQMENC